MSNITGDACGIMTFKNSECEDPANDAEHHVECTEVDDGEIEFVVRDMPSITKGSTMVFRPKANFN